MPTVSGTSSSTNGAAVRRLSAAALVLIIAASVAIRCRYISRGLWTAEAWVANSVLESTLSRMFFYSRWLQTTPPLFLLLVRSAVRVFGLGNAVLRAVPLAFGIAAVLLQAVLNSRMFRPCFAVFGTALVAFSPVAVALSKELKQYSADCAAAALVLLLLWNYRTQLGGRAFRRIVVAFAVLPWLSHTTVAFGPLVLGVLATAGAAHEENSRRVRLWRCIIAGLTLLAAGTLHYVLLIRPNAPPHLSAFWREGFPQLDSFRSAVHFYSLHFAGLPVLFFLEPTSKDALVGCLRAVPPAAQLLAGIAMLVLVGAVLARLRREASRLLVASMAAVPVFSLAALNLLNLYPVSARRLLLSLLPSIALAWTLALEVFWESLVVPRVSARAALRMQSGLVILSAAASVASLLSRPWLPGEREDIEAAMRFLKANATRVDLVYAHASIAEPARLYVRMLHWSAPRIVYGDAGGPCCTRHPEVSGAPSDTATLQDEMRYLLDQGHGRTVWLLSTGRTEHWQELRRNDPALMIAGLSAAGCRFVKTVPVPDVALHELVCGNSTSRDSATLH